MPVIDIPALDLLNEPIPEDWLTTRHCPTCGDVNLVVSSGEVEIGDWCSTTCMGCGRLLRKDTIDADGSHVWEDPEWVKAGEQ